MALTQAGDERICFEAVIERIAPEVPRFIVYPGKAWDEKETFIVDVSLDGVSIGLRNLIPWKERGWHFGLFEQCRKVGVETGDRVCVEMRLLGDAQPDELRELLEGSGLSLAGPISVPSSCLWVSRTVWAVALRFRLLWRPWLCGGGDLRGYLQTVDEDSSAAGLDAVRGEGLDYLGEGELDGLGVSSGVSARAVSLGSV